MYIGLRPMTSEVEDQTIRPAMLASDEQADEARRLPPRRCRRR